MQCFEAWHWINIFLHYTLNEWVAGIFKQCVVVLLKYFMQHGNHYHAERGVGVVCCGDDLSCHVMTDSVLTPHSPHNMAIVPNILC